MKVKYSLVIILLIIVLSGCTTLKKAAQGKEGQTRDDLGCWPPVCSLISNPMGKQLCEDWKAGKQVQWPDCSFMSEFPKCQKLCEVEKNVTTTKEVSEQKQAFNVLPALVKPEFADGITEKDKTFIIQGIGAMDFYLQKWFSKSINQPAGLRVDIVESTENRDKVTIEDGKMVILIGTRDSTWKRNTELKNQFGVEAHSRISAHEYVHVYQFHNGCGNTATESPAPKWFLEGEAEWLSEKAVQEGGIVPSLSIPQTRLSFAKQQTGSLQSFEKPKYDAISVTSYSFYTMAVDFLMKDKPIKALDDFCVNLADGKGMSMPQAFEKAFGISLEKFYENFEAYRKTWSSGSTPSPGQIPQEYCAPFASIPSCSAVGTPDSQNYNYCKQCYPEKATV